MHFARTLSVAFLLSGFFPLLANAEEGMPAFNTEAPAYKALGIASAPIWHWWI